MPSALLVSLNTTLSGLRSTLIVTGKDYDKYTKADQDMALAFRVLASAHLEDYVEQRCIEVAKEAVRRLKQGNVTRCGQSLVVWYIVSGSGKRGSIPLKASECPADDTVTDALLSFTQAVGASHGISGDKLRSMIFRLGLSERDFDPRLFDQLTDLASERGLAAHRRVNRARTMTEPEVEWRKIEQVLKLLEDFDASMQTLL